MAGDGLRVRRRLLTLLTAAVAIVLPAAAYAGTTVGQTFPPGTADSCAGAPARESFGTTAATLVQQAGIITSWSFEGSSDPTTVSLRVFRPVSGTTWSVVGDGGRCRR